MAEQMTALKKSINIYKIAKKNTYLLYVMVSECVNVIYMMLHVLVWLQWAEDANEFESIFSLHVWNNERTDRKDVHYLSPLS